MTSLFDAALFESLEPQMLFTFKQLAMMKKI